MARWLSGYAGKSSAVKPLTTVAAHCKLLKLARQLAKSQSNRIDFRRSFWVQSSREVRRCISPIRGCKLLSHTELAWKKATRLGRQHAAQRR